MGHSHHFFASVALIVIAGCSPPSDQVAPRRDRVPGTVASAVAPTTLRVRGRSIRDQFRQLAHEAPGFAGIFFDQDGQLTVSVATEDFSSASMDRVLSWARQFSVSVAGKSNPKIRRVPYDYAALADAFDRALGAAQADDNVGSARIDETRGRIVFGVKSVRQAAPMLARLSAAGVPADMIGFEAYEHGSTLTTLNQPRSPRIGGLQIKEHNGALCTLGFNMMKWETGTDPSSSPKYFITSGHCSGTWGTHQAWPYYQATDDRIGEEHETVPLRRNDPSCPDGTALPCTDADVLVVAYDSGIPVTYGNVANVDASKTIIGLYNVQGTVSGALTGQTVTMVGMMSGKRTGVVQASCTNQKLFDQQINSDVWFLCTQRVGVSSQGGDSGGPVFIPFASGNPYTPSIVGIVSGGAGGLTWITAIDQIDGFLNYAYFYQ